MPNSALAALACPLNQLTSLDLSANSALLQLGCSFNQLTSLNISANSTLDGLNCSNNQLPSLDLSANSALTSLNCSNNQLPSLDLSANSVLIGLSCSSNQLTSLNLQNGNNVNMSNYSFDAHENPDLSCIEVDDATYSTANWIYIDSASSFSEDCSVMDIAKIENQGAAIIVYPNPTTGQVNLEFGEYKVASVSIYSLSGQIIYQQENMNNAVSTLDFGAAKAGVYILEIKAADERRHQQLLIKQ